MEILKKYAILLIISMLLLLLSESEISKISIKDSQKSKGIKPRRRFNYFRNCGPPKNSHSPVLPIIHPFYNAVYKLVFSKDKSAYQYLSNSANRFPFGKAFNNILEKNGFIGVEDIPQTFGVASIYRAQKPTS